MNYRREQFIKENNNESITVGELLQVLRENHIPEDCALQSDSGWECDETPMKEMYYNALENRIIFTQTDDRGYSSKDGWKLLFSKPEARRKATENEIKF